jgi:hypothetical protein
LRPNSNGVSLFFVDRMPDAAWGLTESLNKYEGSKLSNPYYDFLNNYYKDIFGGNASKIFGSIELVNREVNMHGPFGYSVAIKNSKNDLELIDSICFITGKWDKDEFTATGVNSDIEINEDGSGEICFVNTGKQFCIKEVPVAIYWDRNIDRIKETIIAEKDPNHQILGTKKLGAVPVGSIAIKYKGQSCFLVVAQKNNNEDEITYMWSESDFGDRVVPAWLKDPPALGEEITILYRCYGGNEKSLYKYIDGPTITLKKYTIEKQALQYGKYHGAFFIEDIVGRSVWSNLVPFTVDEAMLDNVAKIESENKLAQDKTGKDILADAQWED